MLRPTDPSDSIIPSSDSRTGHILFSQELLYGVTLNNNPSMQDVWNTAPAWSFPFMTSSVAPTPTASTMVEGALGQQVVGLGGYGLWHQLVYAEITAYRSAQQGVAAPLDESASDVAHNVIPYWRLALQHSFGPTYVMLGTYGLSAKLYPTGISGATDKYTDAAADLQIERPVNRGVVVFRSAFIHESQTLNALFTADEPGAANLHNTLKVFRANASYMPSTRANFQLGYFNTTGTSDQLLVSGRPHHRKRDREPTVVGGNRRVRLQRVAKHPSRAAVQPIQQIQRRIELLRRRGEERIR